MNDGLLDLFRHNAWANRELMEFCRDLRPEQLTAPRAGTYAGILETFNHVVMTEARYLRRLVGSGPAWVDNDGGEDPGDVDVGSLDLDRLRSMNDETDRRWEQFLSEPFDAEQVILLDRGTYQTHAGVLAAQVLHHGNAHREQICAMITAAGTQPPDVQLWGYANATGRARRLPSKD